MTAPKPANAGPTRLLILADTHVPRRAKDLPAQLWAEVDRADLAVVHETGAAPGRNDRMARQFPDTDVLVFGHSHIPWDSTAPGGPRLLNPGSPTDRRRQPVGTYLTAVLGGGELSAVTLHPVRAAAGAPPG